MSEIKDGEMIRVKMNDDLRESIVRLQMESTHFLLCNRGMQHLKCAVDEFKFRINEAESNSKLLNQESKSERETQSQ